MRTPLEKLVLVTGFTQDYRYGDNYERSLNANCNIPFIVFAVNHFKFGRVNLDTASNGNDCFQIGSFLPHLDNYERDTVVVCTDADAEMTRGFDEDELEFLRSFKQGDVGLAYNQWPGATLADEAKLLNDRLTHEEIEAEFPGYKDVHVFNTGFIVATIDTFNQLSNRVRPYHENGKRIFNNHRACIQFSMCYVVGQFLKHRLVKQSIHAHGHFGVPKGVEYLGDRIPHFNGKQVLFRHVI